MTMTPLVTMLVLPDAEPRILERLIEALGYGVKVRIDDEAEDLLLIEQWHHEHPDSAIADRRMRTVSAEVSAEEVSRAAEAVVDLISPHARGEEHRILRGEQVVMTADSIPWFAHAPLWNS